MEIKNAHGLAGNTRSSPIDVYVGSRIRLRRSLYGLSQEGLGIALGITFQQVQKYERGSNRVGASRLFEISRVLNVPVDYFFDDMPKSVSKCPISGRRGRMSASPEPSEWLNIVTEDQQNHRETLELIRAYYLISDQTIRRRALELMKSLSSSEAVS